MAGFLGLGPYGRIEQSEALLLSMTQHSFPHFLYNSSVNSLPLYYTYDSIAAGVEI